MGPSATLLHHIPACGGGVETGVVLGAGLPVGPLAFQECALHKLGDWLVCECSPFWVPPWVQSTDPLSCEPMDAFQCDQHQCPSLLSHFRGDGEILTLFISAGTFPGGDWPAHCSALPDCGAPAPCGGPGLPLLPPRAHLPEEGHPPASLAHTSRQVPHIPCGCLCAGLANGKGYLPMMASSSSKIPTCLYCLK